MTKINMSATTRNMKGISKLFRKLPKTLIKVQFRDPIISLGQTIKLDLTGCVFPDCRACESGDKGGPVYSGEFLDCRSTKPRAMTEKVRY